ncbi:thiamin pyrophosphokinase 1 isoform X2 [Ostrinia nubilalis]
MIFNVLYMQLNNCGTSCNLLRCWKWDVTQLITRSLQTKAKYAIVILNRPISQKQEFITNLWNNALVRMTVDGGTTRWDKFLKELPENVQSTMKYPDLITGDFDSIGQDILQKYKKSCKVKSSTNLNVIHTPDQDYTDFTKALIELCKHCQQIDMEIDHVLTICQSSGRLDQILGNIQTLFLATEKALLSPNTRVYIITDDAVSWLLCPGEHIISIPEQTRFHKRAWCSLVPIGETCSYVTTTGLKWNLVNQPLRFGEVVSTSNTFDGSETVTVKCSNTVLWSMRVPSLCP